MERVQIQFPAADWDLLKLAVIAVVSSVLLFSTFERLALPLWFHTGQPMLSRLQI